MGLVVCFECKPFLMLIPDRLKAAGFIPDVLKLGWNEDFSKAILFMVVVTT